MKKLLFLTLQVILISCNNLSVNPNPKAPNEWTHNDYWSYYDWNQINYFNNYLYMYNSSFIGDYAAYRSYDKSKGIQHLTLPNKEILTIKTLLSNESDYIPDTTLIKFDNLGRISNLNNSTIYYSSDNKIDSIISDDKKTIYKYEGNIINYYYNTTQSETNDTTIIHYNNDSLSMKHYFDDSSFYVIDPNLDLIAFEENWSFEYDDKQPYLKFWILNYTKINIFEEYSDIILLKSVETNGMLELYLYTDEQKLDSIYRENSTGSKFKYNNNGNISEYINNNYKTKYFYSDVNSMPEKYITYRFDQTDYLWHEFLKLEIIYL